MADREEKKSRAMDELRHIQEEDAVSTLQYQEPELQEFDSTQMFYLSDDKKSSKPKFRFGKRAQRKAQRVHVQPANFENRKMHMQEIHFADDPNQPEVSDTVELPSMDELQKVEETKKVSIPETKPEQEVEADQPSVMEEVTLNEPQDSIDEIIQELEQEEAVKEEPIVEEQPVIEEVQEVVEEQPIIEEENIAQEPVVEETIVEEEQPVVEEDGPVIEEFFEPKSYAELKVDDVEVEYDEEPELDMDAIDVEYVDHPYGQIRRKKSRNGKAAELPVFDPYTLEGEEVYEEHKRFSIVQFEKEEQYLQEKSSNGYHFLYKAGKKYYFKKDVPEDYEYRILYYAQLPTEDDVEEWDDKGWNFVVHYPSRDHKEAGWYIVRHKVEEGMEGFDIYNDDQKASFLRKYVASLRSSLFLMFICMMCCVVTAYLQWQFNGYLIGLILCGVIFFIAFISYISYYRVMRKTRKYLAELKRRIRIHENQSKIEDQNDDYESETQLAFDWERLDSNEK